MPKTLAPLSAISSLALALGLFGCGGDDGDPEASGTVQVLHLSPDAPNIDAFVDGETMLATNLAFTSAGVPTAVGVGSHTIEVAATGTGAAAAVVTIADVLVEEGRTYTAFAFGKLAEAQLAVVEDSTQGLASGHVRVRVVHTGAGIGNVDVYAIGSNGTPDPIADNLRYGTAAEPVDLPTAAFTAGVDVDADGASDLLFPIPALPAGVVVNVFAVVDAAGSPFLLAQLPSGTVRIDAPRQRLRAVHLSPDAPAVQPLFNGDPLGEITFPSSSDYVDVSVPSGKLEITTDGTPATAVLSADLTFTDGASVTAVAIGRVAELGALVFEDDSAGLAATSIRVRAIHGAPDVGQVDLYNLTADGTASSLLADVDFGTAADPLDLPAGAYTIGVDVTDDATPDLYFQLPELPGGTLANVYVTNDADGKVFVLAQLDGAVTVRIDAAESQVRVMHLSRDAPNVDVYGGTTRVVTDLPFKSQSAFLTVPSGSLPVAVTAAGAPMDTAVIEANLSLLPGRKYTVVAYDDVAAIKALVLEDDAAGLAATNIRVPITHTAPGVTRGDIFVLLDGGMTFGTQLVDDFGFGETAPFIDVPAGMYTVGFDAEANGDIQAVFNLPLLTPGTYARAYVIQEQDDSVGLLVQLADSTSVIPAM